MTTDYVIIGLGLVAAYSSSVSLLLLFNDRSQRRTSDLADALCLPPGMRMEIGAEVAAPLDDKLARFLADCTIAQPGARVQSSALYDAFDGWCRQNGERCWSQKGFSKSLLDSGYTKRLADCGMEWIDLRLIGPVMTGEVAQ